ncbi:MAG: 2Fe-2S iron-sulfur cluster-binding protein, partial [Pseudomonadota bacterium]
RLAQGGLIDRSQALSFRFDGRRIAAHPGDTVASALLAAGVRLVGRSFKHHRPRGVLSAGVEEPNALVGVGRGARHEPNARATVREVQDGLRVVSQNRWPSLSFDAGQAADLAKPLLGAGFYYKTFMWPAAFWERVYEPLIRNAAGLGRLSGRADPDPAEKRTRECDLLVIGAGPSGLMAAREAARAGLRVVLAEEDFRVGGRLLAEGEPVGGRSGPDWAEGVRAELESLGVRVMTRTAVFGAYDHGLYGALERRPDGGVCLWRIHARTSVLAAGAIERPVGFEGNDRPGVMLAGAVRAYLNRWAVRPGAQAVVLCADDAAWRTAEALAAAGAEVLIADARSADALPAAPAGATVSAGTVVCATRGRLGLSGVRLRSARGERWVSADLLAVSGGWSPSVHLSCHHRGRPVWDAAVGGFVPGAELPPGMTVAGAADGVMTTRGALVSGGEAGRAAAEALGASVGAFEAPEAEDRPRRFGTLLLVEGAGKGAYVDLQNDVTVADVGQAEQEGFRSVEHLKRYTTLGMATDQGKTGNVLGLAALAQASGVSIAEAGTTIYRPPWTPVPISAFGGDHKGEAYRPAREAPSH